MCGLAGTYKSSVDVESMLLKIIHRGRDDQGIRKHGDTVHGHVRLSLLDLSSASKQPFLLNNSTLSFNGEIWNYRDIKKKLQDDGYRFNTTGDTEVLSQFLDIYGVSQLNQLEGMFAFAWSKEQEHWLVRDRFGEIPLYLAKTNKGYIWASERKAFPSGVIPVSIPPGYAFNLVKGEWFQWYKLPGTTPQQNILDCLNRGVEQRLNADAPVCCLISGGLDSVLVLQIAKSINKNIVAFTAKMRNDSNDLLAARRVCSEYEIQLIEVPVSIDLDSLTNAAKVIEINSKAQIEIASLCLPLAQRIRAEGFKSCLSGEAADELFGGYGNFCIQASKSTNTEVISLRKSQLAKMSRGNFVRCNKAFMYGGVECRLPFMDVNLVEYAINLNLLQSPANKKLLKSAAAKLLPKWVISRVKDTFQGGSGVSTWTEENIASPIKFYNNELKKTFGYLPKD